MDVAAVIDDILGCRDLINDVLPEDLTEFSSLADLEFFLNS